MYTRVLSACPLLGGLSSSFIGGFTIMVRTFHCCPNFWIPELFEGPTNCSNYSP